MTGFKPIRYDSGKLDTKTLAASQTITKGMALVDSSGYLAEADSAAVYVEYVAMEAKTSGSGEHPTIQVVKTNDVEFEAVCNSTITIAKEQYMADLSNSKVVNESATSNNVFLIEHVIDAANKIVTGRFIQKVS